MRALHTAATGMMAQELNVQVISNNIANMRTTGYKRQRAEFQDLLYEHVSRVGSQTSTQGNILPAGIEIGSGVKTVGDAARHDARRRSPPTGKDLDVAIRGEGFFKIAMPDGRTAYTRDGSFERDAQGRWSPSTAIVVQPGITIPQNATSVTINAQGQVSATPARHRPRRPSSARSQLARFVNKAGLQAIGDNLFVETPASGTPQDGTPNTDGFGDLHAGLPRTGQRRRGHRNLRPDRRAARLRDERQGHHRGRPDAVGHVQPDALRNQHMIRTRSRIALALAAALAHRRVRCRDRRAPVLKEPNHRSPAASSASAT